MLAFLLITGIAFGIAYWFSSTGLELWRSVAGFFLAFMVAWFGGAALASFLFSFVGSFDVAVTALSLLGKGFWWAALGSGVGVYRARYRLRTGQNAPPLKFPKSVSIAALAILVVGVLLAVALPAYQDYIKRQASAESKPWERYQEKKGASASSDERSRENNKQVDPAPNLEPFYGKTDEELARERVKKSAFDREQWSGNAFDRFDTVGSIELRARQFPSLNELRAWAAVIAWQAYYMADGQKSPNEALYVAVGTVLEGFKDNRGVCRPGRVVVVDAASASDAFPVGTAMTLLECDR